MQDEFDFIWKYTPERRKRLNGSTRLIGLTRKNKGVWLTFQEVTPAELSLLKAFATAAESKHREQMNRQIEVAKKRR